MAGERVGEGIIEDGAVGIQGNRIVAVGKVNVVCAQYQAHRMIDVEGNVILAWLCGWSHAFCTGPVPRAGAGYR